MGIEKITTFLNDFKLKIYLDAQSGLDFYNQNSKQFNYNEIKVIQADLIEEINNHLDDNREILIYDVKKEEELTIAFLSLKIMFEEEMQSDNFTSKFNFGEKIKVVEIIKLFKRLKNDGTLINTNEEICDLIFHVCRIDNGLINKKTIASYLKDYGKLKKANNL